MAVAFLYLRRPQLERVGHYISLVESCSAVVKGLPPTSTAADVVTALSVLRGRSDLNVSALLWLVR